MMFPARIAIVGLGLIGGSLAQWIRKMRPDIDIVGVDVSDDSIRKATLDGAVQSGVSCIDDIEGTVDIVFVCVPIPLVHDMIVAAFRQFGTDTLITDVASVKGGILAQLPPDVAAVFIPGHPMAGSQFQGYDGADLGLMKGAPYLVVPTSHPKWALFTTFLLDLSFQVIPISAQVHDHVVGMVSHLGYWVSVGMGQLVADSNADQYELARQVAGPGFSSMTRLCGKDPQWALNVAQHNRTEVVGHLRGLVSKLHHILDALETGDDDELKACGEEARGVYQDFYGDVS